MPMSFSPSSVKFRMPPPHHFPFLLSPPFLSHFGDKEGALRTLH